MPETKFSLKTIAREVLRESPYDEEDVLTDQVFARIEPEDYLPIVRDAIVSTLGEVIRDLRRGSEIVLHNADEPEVEEPQGGKTMPVNTWKRDARYQDYINQRIRVVSLNAYKRIGDLSLEEVQEVAQTRYEQAEANRAAGDRFTRIATAMVGARAKTVKDLDPATLVATI